VSDIAAPRIPCDPLVTAANKALADPDFRASIRQMSLESYPLVKMVEDLGLDEDMSPQIRNILENLASDVVDGIRLATLDMLDNGDHEIPLVCDVTHDDIADGAPLEIQVELQFGRQMIQVRRKI
jgi:hypothetical protein